MPLYNPGLGIIWIIVICPDVSHNTPWGFDTQDKFLLFLDISGLPIDLALWKNYINNNAHSKCQQHHKKDPQQTCSRWWFQRFFFNFQPETWGRWTHFDLLFLWNGLKLNHHLFLMMFVHLLRCWFQWSLNLHPLAVSSARGWGWWIGMVALTWW